MGFGLSDNELLDDLLAMELLGMFSEEEKKEDKKNKEKEDK